jgi:TRAP transporter TAXI family solute receptor
MQLRWLSGPRGASWLEIDTALARLIEPDLSGTAIRVVPGGGRENIASLAAGMADLATSIDQLAAAAIRGEDPFGPGPIEQLRALGQGWMRIPFHVVHAVGAGPASLRDALVTPGLRIGVPPRSTSDELTFRRVLELCGSSYQAIVAAGGLVIHADYTALSEHFEAAEIDYFFGATAAPSQAIQLMAQGARATELLAIEDRVAKDLVNAGYAAGVLVAGTYPLMQSRDIPTVEMSSILLTTTALPDSLATEITRSLLGQVDAVRAIHPSLIGFGSLVKDDTLVALHEGVRRTD